MMNQTDTYAYRVYRSRQRNKPLPTAVEIVHMWITDQITLGRAMWDDFEILDGSDA